MKLRLFAYFIILTITNVNLSVADDCNKFDKLSKEYAKCTAELIKEMNRTEIMILIIFIFSFF